MKEKIKELQTLCEKLHIDLRVQYYDHHEICFKGMTEQEKEVFNVAVWYSPKSQTRRFCIEINSDYEEWRGGQFTKDELALLMSVDDLSDDELHIRQCDLCRRLEQKEMPEE